MTCITLGTTKKLFYDSAAATSGLESLRSSVGILQEQVDDAAASVDKLELHQRRIAEAVPRRKRWSNIGLAGMIGGLAAMGVAGMAGGLHHSPLVTTVLFGGLITCLSGTVVMAHNDSKLSCGNMDRETLAFTARMAATRRDHDAASLRGLRQDLQHKEEEESERQRRGAQAEARQANPPSIEMQGRMLTINGVPVPRKV